MTRVLSSMGTSLVMLNWQAANDKNSLASLGLSTGTANMNTGLLGQQGAAIGSGYDLTTGQNQQALQGLAGSGAVGAAGNRNQLASLNKQYYGGGDWFLPASVARLWSTGSE